jgi:hypothetical protein
MPIETRFKILGINAVRNENKNTDITLSETFGKLA